MIRSFTLITAFATIATFSYAGDDDPYFRDGKLVIPKVVVDGSIYYAELTLVDSQTLSFSTDFERLTNITPPEEVGSSVNLDDADIVGTWLLNGVPQSELYIIFRENGTYEHFEADDDEECSTGIELGTYTWDRETGQLFSSQTLDENGACGLSSDDPPPRVFINGDEMQLLDRESSFDPESYSLHRI